MNKTILLLLPLLLLGSPVKAITDHELAVEFAKIQVRDAIEKSKKSGDMEVSQYLTKHRDIWVKCITAKFEKNLSGFIDMFEKEDAIGLNKLSNAATGRCADELSYLPH